MKNKFLEGFVVIIIANILLIAFSYFLKKEIVFGEYESSEYSLKSPDFESLFDFTYDRDNRMAEANINKYLDSNSFDYTVFFKRESFSGLKPRKESIYLVNNSLNGVYALDAFFNSLSETDSSLVRIAHYGDSQIEADRLTFNIRALFQQEFGGSGIGYVPLKTIAESPSYWRSISGNWGSYDVFANRTSKFNYGIAGRVSSYTTSYYQKQDSDSTQDNDISPEQGDSIEDKGTLITTNKAFININPYSSIFSNVKVLLGEVSDTCNLAIWNSKENTLIKSYTLNSTNRFSYIQTQISNPSKIKAEFTSPISPEVFGLCFDSETGIQVDNFGIRGHSGDGLLRIEPEHLSVMLNQLNYKLIILQFGANVVPYIDSEEELESLKQLYKNLFFLFRNAKPDMSIIVIGPNDMTRFSEGSYSSYKWLEPLNIALQEAAAESGCAFWDLYDVMGGENSIVSWKKHGLASYDGHLSPSGRQVIATELFKSIMTEYNMYLYRSN